MNASSGSGLWPTVMICLVMVASVSSDRYCTNRDRAADVNRRLVVEVVNRWIPDAWMRNTKSVPPPFRALSGGIGVATPCGVGRCGGLTRSHEISAWPIFVRRRINSLYIHDHSQDAWSPVKVHTVLMTCEAHDLPWILLFCIYPNRSDLICQIPKSQKHLRGVQMHVQARLHAKCRSIPSWNYLQ